MNSSGNFTVRRNEQCLRGLEYEYRLAHDLDATMLLLALTARFGDRFVVGHETWGHRSVARFVLQYRFEVRTGAADRSLALVHRVLAPEAQRGSDRALFEEALRAATSTEPA